MKFSEEGAELTSGKGYLVALAANSAAGLQAQAQLAAATLPAFPPNPPPGAYRAAVVAESPAQWPTRLAALAAGREEKGVWQSGGGLSGPPPVAFLFTGHGAQYQQMGRTLYDTAPAFRQAILACERELQAFLPKPLTAYLYPEQPRGDGEPDPLLETMTWSQPAIFAVEYALARLWQSWGISPAVVMGHSVGEYVAACIAGCMRLADGLKLVAARGRLMDTLAVPGKMVAVFATEEVVSEALAPYQEHTAVAVINGRTNIVISGSREAIDQVMVDLKARRIKMRPLAVAQASHSPLLAPILDEFEETAATIQFSPPQLPYVSCVTGKLVEAAEGSTPGYWRRHLRQTVRFAEGMETLHAAGHQVYLEIGPAPVLLRMGKRCLPRADQTWLPSIDPKMGDWPTIAGSLAQLYTQGAEINWLAFGERVG